MFLRTIIYLTFVYIYWRCLFTLVPLSLLLLLLFLLKADLLLARRIRGADGGTQLLQLVRLGRIRDK